MKLQSTIKRFGIFALAFALPCGAAFAGSKMSKMVEVPPPPAELCFAAGEFSVDIFGGYVWGEEDSGDSVTYEDAATGGVGLNYFFTEMIGVGADAYWFDGDGVIHSFDGSLIVRFPIQEICLAPYVYGGGGFHANSINQGSVHAGGGVEYRFADAMGVFVDGRYTWTEDTNDLAMARAGLRFVF